MRIAPPSLPPHHSGPATRDFQSSISVEALLRGYHLDVQGLLRQLTLRVLSHGPVRWSPPSRSGGGFPTHAPLQPNFPGDVISFAKGFLVLV